MHDAERRGDDNYEQTDWHLKVVLFTGVILTATVAVCFAIGFVIMKSFDARPAATEFQTSPMAAQYTVQTSSDRPLQPNPGAARAAFDVRQRLQDQYEQVSADPPIYRLPVATAMHIVATDGLPQFPQVVSAEPLTPPAADAERGVEDLRSEDERAQPQGDSIDERRQRLGEPTVQENRIEQ